MSSLELIQPLLSGPDLLRDIQEADPGEGRVAIWWLGQSGYAIKGNGRVVWIDLYLSEHLTVKYAATDKPHVRMTAVPLRGGEITDARLVLASHKHSDHLDPATLPDLFAASPEARLLLPKSLVDYVVGLGLPRERLIPADAGDRLEIDGVVIEPIPSAHEGFDRTDGGGYPYLGFLIRFGPITLYHSGDTIPYDGLAERLIAAGVDVAFLPINGRDARRKALGVPGNMTIDEAVDLLARVRPKLAIPHHYDMFTFNTANVADFERAMEERIPDQRFRVLRCGERFVCP